MQRNASVVDMGIVTPPRQITPGQLCFVTARAVNRSYRFVPRRAVRDAIAFSLAAALRRFRGRISLHEFLWMSNHFHLVLTDVEGCLPDFMEALNSLLSRSLNALRGINGTNIEKGYNLVLVHGDHRLLEHCVYTLANPCNAHLVARSRHWQGVSSLRLQYGVPLRVKRPERGLWAIKPRRRRGADASKRVVQRRRSTLPEVLELVIERPGVLLALSDAELRSRIRTQLAERERALIDLRRASGKKVLGWNAVVRMSFWSLPGRTEEMFGTVPSISSDDAGTRARVARARQAFLNGYRAAIERFMRGDHDVSFPIGTWLMKVRFGVRCCPLPDS